MSKVGNVKVNVYPEVHRRAFALGQIAKPAEVLLLLFADIDESRTIHVRESYLPYQDIRGGFCEINKVGLVKMPHELGIDRYQLVRGIYHTHGSSSSSATWSPTDDKFLNSIMTPGMPFFISLMPGGGRGKMNGRVEIMSPFRASLKADVTLIDVNPYIDEYVAEFKERCTIIKPKIYKKTGKKGAKKPKPWRPKGTKGILDGVISDLNPLNWSYASDDVDSQRFSEDNILLDEDGDPMCCGYKIANLGNSGTKFVLYCRYCYTTTYLPRAMLSS